uniref:Uncharacterized protein n=1 Tax=Thermus sp. WG TaxID=1312524 RepID=R4JC09_9DEIN|nr:hypothetical protein WG13_02 [Thermus sp. WG]
MKIACGRSKYVSYLTFSRISRCLPQGKTKFLRLSGKRRGTLAVSYAKGTFSAC